MSAVLIFQSVPGSPHQPGEIVRVAAAIDQEVHDVTQYVGRIGRVKYLEYSCGCGQSFPSDPMIGVRFADGSSEEFWKEELSQIPRKAGR